MSALMWIAFVALAVLVAFLLMAAIDALGNTRTIRRINGWAAIDAARRDPLSGGSLSWCRQHSPRGDGLTWTRPTVTPAPPRPLASDYQLDCGHYATVPGPAGATTGRAWCVTCGESREVTEL